MMMGAVVLSTAFLVLPGLTHGQQANPRADSAKDTSGRILGIRDVKPGMTRAELLTMVTTEGGLSTRIHRTYVSRTCRTCKIDVDFRPGGNTDRDSEGRLIVSEDPQDVVVKVSAPYNAPGIYD